MSSDGVGQKCKQKSGQHVNKVVKYPGNPRVDFNFILAERNSQDLGVIFFGRNLFASLSFHVKFLGEVGIIPNFVIFHLFNLVFFSLHLSYCGYENYSTQ